uniref:Tyrosine--tRNA ligase n=1 Tax=Steinernema glaseri TaxID=37863 RepID=A0A1I8A0R9_9BILA
MLLAVRRIQRIRHICSRYASSSSQTRDAPSVGALLDFCVDLKERKLISESHPPNIPDKQRELLNNLPGVLYAGFDPTADGLHVGNLLILTALCRSTLFNCEAIAVVGSATALIGDPSGRNSERDELQKSTVASNSAEISEQIEKILGNVRKIKNEAKTRVLNNMDWWNDKNANDFRQISEHFRVGNMLRMGAIKTRLDEVAGINYSEFCYQIFQSADWNYLAEKYNCYFQMGGSDQLGHIDSGYDFIRRMTGQLSAGICLPLVTDDKGRKLGKSVSSGRRAIWLDRKKTSPKDFYDFFYSQSDEMAAKLLMYYSLRPVGEIRDLIAHSGPNEGQLQRELAEEMTSLVHGDSGVQVEHAQAIKFPSFQHIRMSDEERTQTSHCLDKLRKDLSERRILSHVVSADDRRVEMNGRPFSKIGSSSVDLKLVDLLSITALLRSTEFGCKPVILTNSSLQAEAVNAIVSNCSKSNEVEVYDTSSWWSQISCLDFVREARSFRTEDMLNLRSLQSQMNTGVSNDVLIELIMSIKEWEKLSSDRHCLLQIATDNRSDFLEYGIRRIPGSAAIRIDAEEQTSR